VTSVQKLKRDSGASSCGPLHVGENGGDATWNMDGSAFLAARTKKIKLGTSYPIPFRRQEYWPDRLDLDIISNGRQC